MSRVDTGDSADTGTRDCRQVWGSGCGWNGDTRLNAQCLGKGQGGGGGAAGSVGGGGCSCDAAVGPSPFWLALLLVLIRRVAPLLLLLPALAHAVDAQHLHATDGGDFPALQDPDLGEAWSTAAWAANHWGQDLVVLYDNPEGGALLKSVQTMEFGGSINLGGWSRVGFVLPTDMNVVGPLPKPRTGVGDLTVWGGVPLTQPDRAVAASLTFLADIPTGRPQYWLGDTHGGVTAMFAWSFHAGPFQGAMNLGPRIQRKVPIPGGIWGSRWLYGLGLRAEPGGPLFFTGELFGAVPVVPWAPIRALKPAEVLGTIGMFGRAASIAIGGGGGLGHGLGSPSSRILLLADFRRRAPGDRDGDGIPDPVDLCRAEPEDLDDFRDEDGCPDLDNDRDGLADAEDLCPLRPETRNGYADDDGCPDGTTRLGLNVEAAEGTVLPETVEVKIGDRVVGTMAGEPVYRTLPWGEVEVAAWGEGFGRTARTLDLDGAELELTLVLQPEATPEPAPRPTLDQTVRFEPNSAELLDTDVLELLRTTLQEHPEIALIRVEGHADSVGGPRYNYELSLERARAVAAWLTERGIAPERMDVIGSGEAHPGEDGGRRVSFQILIFEP